jgi:hypothetical protein
MVPAGRLRVKKKLCGLRRSLPTQPKRRASSRASVVTRTVHVTSLDCRVGLTGSFHAPH